MGLTKKEFWSIAEDNELLLMDGYDDCIVGLMSRFGQPSIVCYDQHKVIKKLVSQGMTHDEADEWFEYNQIGAWMGETTPCFLSAVASAMRTPQKKKRPAP